ncbi:MAG: hypothetical protein MUF75_09705 [Bacteroidia bacterium]|jgi:hypothetical protein|nr:hypothetical protein [Bacteroidia bacterium]
MVFLSGAVFAQEDNTFGRNTFDYKDPEQFKNFNKRSKVVAYWQISELKAGAIVVRLRNNRLLIDELNKSGNKALAKQKIMEQYAMNKNTMMAYIDHFDFCKVYFMYSNSSDSLLNGHRKGIFLDTTLAINPNIELKETFYLIAERDYAYNSTIGFVKEDSARLVKETGTAVRMMAVVLKNKFFHQLKAPFPYLIKEKNFMDADLDFPMAVTETDSSLQLQYTVNKTYFAELAANPKNKASVTVLEKDNIKVVHVKKQFTYEKVADAVVLLNESLERFYNQSPRINAKKLDPKFAPYLY